MKRHFCLLLAGVVAGAAPTARAIENVILFIGDGMGFEHVKAGRAFVHGNTSTPLTFETLGFTAQSITTLPDDGVTDSATAATAIATGYQHPVNGVISMGANNSIKQTLIEWAHAKGMLTAIVTTDDIGGATPGAFGAHEPDRANMAAIRLDYLQADIIQGHGASLPRVLLGGGFNDAAYVSLAKDKDYNFASTAAALNTANAPLLGLFGTSWGPMTPMAYRDGATTQPTLSQMVDRALTFMGGASKGFLVVVESANIDKLSHSKDANVAAEVAELNAAVETAMAWIDSNSGYASTHILVTADHETGGLSVKNQALTPGSTPDMTFSTDQHTKANVPLYGTWPFALDGTILDNTVTFFLVQDALNSAGGGQPPIITELQVTDVTQTGATVRWTTFEPADNQVLFPETASVSTSAESAWGNSHIIYCTGLNPGTSYSVTARSADWLGFVGTATITFRTPGDDPNAYVVAEPLVGPGSVSGTYEGTLARLDGATQTIVETADGAGAGIGVQYVLQTAIPVEQIASLTLDAQLSWSGVAPDVLIAAVRVLTPGGGESWEPITFPFKAEPPMSYVDAQGKIVVRFEDGAAVKRERKDTLVVDHLFGEVVKSTSGVSMPTTPMVTANLPTATSVSLSWSKDASQLGYQIWRYVSATGWTLLAEQATAGYLDTTVAPSTTYSYVVRAFSAEAYADSTAVWVSTPAPPPVALTAPVITRAAVVKGAVSLGWTDPNTNETGYQVLRSTAQDGPFGVVATLGANVIKYSDKAVTRGTLYYYQVRAVAGSQLGPTSATISVQP